MRRLFRTFLIPALLAGACLAGLIAGLLGDGLVDIAAAAGLSAPIVVLAWALIRRRR